MFLQAARSECGLVAVAMVARAHGLKCRPTDVRPLLEVGRDGASAYDLVELAPKLGLRARPLRVGLDSLRELPLPAVCACDGDHFVVVVRFGRRGVLVHDPARGRLWLPMAEAAQRYGGVAILFERAASAPGDRRRPASTTVSRFLRKEILRAAPQLAALIATTLIANTILLMSPIIIGRVIGRLAASHDIAPVAIAAAAASLTTLAALSSLIRTRLGVLVQRRVDYGLSAGFFDHLLHLGPRELADRGTGDLLARIDSLGLARQVFTSQLVNTLLDGGLLVVAVMLVLRRATIIGLVLIAAIAVQLVVLGALSARLRQATNRAATAEGELSAFGAEALSGYATIKSLGAESAMADRYRRLVEVRLHLEAIRDRQGGRLEALVVSSRVALPLAVLFLSLGSFGLDRRNLGELVTVVGLVGAALTPASSLAGALQAVQSARGHLARLSDILELAPEPDGERLALRGTIELRNVGVRYPGSDRWAVRHVTATIRAGSHTGIVGPSGSGKSTLAAVIAGMIEPTEGAILIDGKPLSGDWRPSYRRSIGVVRQDVWLFAGTIAENIAIERDWIDSIAVQVAAHRAAIAYEIESLPLGYHTRLTDGGGGLSGGQRQRLAIARAVAGYPSIIVFDEATSSLDSLTEARVARAISALGATRITVTHRASTIADADQVLALDHGRLIDQPTGAAPTVLAVTAAR